MRILELNLRGAIGIRKGLGVEEITIDFRNFEPGLVALTGRNGSGKTTIMENLHPFRTMVSKDGSLASHFYLKDSYRILTFEYDGSEYRSTILIDALTGKSEAYLHRGGQPLNDGKLTTYDELITELLGSQELFFNSVFSGQKSKGISALSAGERRKLFYELLNLTKYEMYCEWAKQEAKNCESKIAELRGRYSALEEGVNTPEYLRERLYETNRAISRHSEQAEEQQKELDALSAALTDCVASLKQLEKKKEENRRLQQAIEYKSTQFEEENEAAEEYRRKQRWEIDKLLTNNERKQKILANRDKIMENLTAKRKIESEVAFWNAKKMEIQEATLEAKKVQETKLRAIRETEKILREREQEIRKEERRLEKMVSEQERMEQSSGLIDEVPCDEETGSRCKFLQMAFGDRAQLEGKRVLIGGLKANLETMKEDFGVFRAEAEAENERFNAAAKQELEALSEQMFAANEAIAEAKLRLEEVATADWEKLLQEADDAKAGIERNQNSMVHLEEAILERNRARDRRCIALELEIEELKAQLSPVLEEELDRLIGDEAEIRDKIWKGKKTLTEINAELLAQEGYRKQLLFQISEEEGKAGKREELLKEQAKEERQLKEWAFLAKAFDKTGIPVLKLENSGIEITGIANELLSLFENKFRIVFETTALTKDKKKLKETFDINVIEENGVCEIGNKSGGQQVWLETAIQLAISLVVRQQGRNIRTSFLDEKDGALDDEKDGALDAENAVSYIEMLRKAHEMSGVHNTFVITHRPELLGFIQQQVRLEHGYLGIAY